MTAGSAPRTAFVLLLGGGHARAAAEVLRAEAAPANVVEPPVTGVRFFTAQGDEGRALDDWYARTDLGDAPPHLLLWHDPELAEWARGTDAQFWVAVPDEGVAASYRGHPNLHAVVTWDARELAHQAAAASRRNVVPRPAGFGTDPFALLAAVGPLTSTRAAAPGASTAIIPIPVKTPERPPGLLRRIRSRLRPLEAGSPPALGMLLVGARPFCVAVLGPAGGAGRTGSAAALATVLAEAVRALSRTVALVDGHLGDPGAWAALSVSGSPPTLEALVTALRENRRPASPGYGGSPALQVYPEAAGGSDGYPPADLHRAAEYLRRQHLAVVVDLPPEVPETLDSASATRAAWLAEADVAVVVAGADQGGLTEIHRRLQAEVMRGKRIVACLVGARPRPGRDRPELVALFENLRSHVTRVVELPDDDVGTAGLLQRGPTEAARQATLRAYTRYAGAVIEVASAP